MLQVGIAGEDTKEPAFVHLKTIDMRRMIEWKELVTPNPILSSRDKEEQQREERLFRSLEKHHELLWEDLAGKPGWKIVVHHDPGQLSALRSEGGDDVSLSLDISFCFHHAYSDGRGGYIFHADLQRALNDTVVTTGPSELQDHILHLPTPPLLPPAMDALIPLSLSWPYILRTVWAEVLYPVLVPGFLRRLLGLELSEAELPWTGQPVNGSHPKMHIRTLLKLEDETQLKAILARCRSHKASLTGLFHALIARSLARLVEEKSFCSMTPISLAGYADSAAAGSTYTPNKTIHCLITGLSCTHDLNIIQKFRQGGGGANNTRPSDEQEDKEDAIWAFAQDMTARLRAKAASLPRDDVLGLSGLVGDWHEFFRKKFGKPREGTWELSNLGSLGAADAGAGGPWAIDRAVFTQGANAVGAAISVNVAGVAGHGIYITVSWQDGIVDDALVEEFVGDFRASVAELGVA